MSLPEVLTPAVAIIGAGPSGLTAAANLAPKLNGDVLVIERERQPGGIPRHSDHTGYGLRDLRRVMTGPAYAARLLDTATRSGASILTEAMVTHLESDRTLSLTTPQGRTTVRPRALILATGARERPRSARLIAGDRPAGVYTTGHLQNLVHLHHRRPGTRAVIVGAELVSWSAAVTLREAGCRTVLMTTTYDRSESYKAFSLLGPRLLGVPLATHTKLLAIEGHDRVQAVRVQDTRTGETRRIECDTVVLTGDWIPDNELARAADLELEDNSRSPVVDAALHTSQPGIFAIGNLVHPVDTADIAALDGRHVANSVLRWLDNPRRQGHGPRIVAESPLRWIAPSRIDPRGSAPARNRLLAWCDAFIARPRIVVRQHGETLVNRRLPWPAAPGRVLRVPANVLGKVDTQGSDITITVK